MKVKNSKNADIYKKLDPPVRKELNRLKRLAKNSITDLRHFEAYQDYAYEPYIRNPHGFINFALSRKQYQILDKNIEKLDLKDSTKELIHKRTFKFFIDFRYEYHDRINFRKTAIENKGLKDLREKFEGEIDNILSRYRKEFFTTSFSFQITQFQIDIMKLFHDHFDDDPLEIALEKELIKLKPEMKDWEQKLIDRYAPRNRPSYECYAPYLFDLSNIIQEEKANYNPIIVKFLKSFQNTPFDIFDSFVVNKASIRSIISKYRRHMNKAE